MKKIGIVGGLGPASTVDYYMGIIAGYTEKFGADVYPEIVIDSVNMGELLGHMYGGRFDEASAMIRKSMANLKGAGADFAAVASNTPHIMWDKFGVNGIIPMISIVDATCNYIVARGYKRILIFAIEYTLKNGLYSKALAKRGIESITPSQEDIKELGGIIYPNLENGIVIESDKKRMISIAEKYIKDSGADSLLLGCTEIPLMIKPGDVSVPVINTTQIHIGVIMNRLLDK